LYYRIQYKVKLDLGGGIPSGILVELV